MDLFGCQVYSMCMLESAICPSGVTSWNLCIVFVCGEGGEGAGVVYPTVSVLFVVTGIISVGYCASWLNDSCAVPLTFSSLLFVVSVSPLSSCFLFPFFILFCFVFLRTNLHACLLIISLACLHDVESQAKPPLWPHHPTIVCDVSLSSPDQYLATHWPWLKLNLIFLHVYSCFCVGFCLFLCFFFLCIEMWKAGERSSNLLWKRFNLGELFFCCCECFKREKNLWDF